MPDAAHLLADIINPVLAVLCVGVPLARPSVRLPVWAWVTSAVAIAVPVMLAEEGKRAPVWAGHPSFPSGHMAFATAAATCLVWADQRWLVAAVPLCTVMGWALVRAQYHTPIDVFGSVLFAPPTASLCILAVRRLTSHRDGA